MTIEGNVVLIDAPSNLGLRPPAPGCVPGCYKAPGALRDAGLLDRLGAREGGVVVPPRYEPAWTPESGVRNGAAIVEYSVRLARRIDGVRRAGGFPLLVGGECSNVIGAAMDLHATGRYGLAYLDGHSDFRNPGNSAEAGIAVGGEALALVTGRGADELGVPRSLVRDEDVVQLGIRDADEDVDELRAVGITVVTSDDIRTLGIDNAVGAAAGVLARPELDGFWIHLDVDIVDGELLPAVDSPDPEGITFEQLAALLKGLLSIGGAVGMNIGIYDPDLDPDLVHAGVIVETLAAAFGR
ncbi:arginase family protein [Pseudonocardia sp. TRM90224]|uniref:arginase family protein n=1 Tax=Pseudonocardia sp. TRM90224 TaxID=2812678 RepID=UPI001E625DB2|nr:arginase family protein [Pseudonocardia sp. TRM90224]